MPSIRYYLFEYWINTKRTMQILNRYSIHTFNTLMIKQIYVYRHIIVYIYDNICSWNSMYIWSSYCRWAYFVKRTISLSIYICRVLPSIIVVTSHGRHVFYNHRQLDCSFNNFFGLTTTKKFKARYYWPFLGESTGHRCIPSQKTSIAESVSMSWRLHEWPMMSNMWSVIGLRLFILS